MTTSGTAVGGTSLSYGDFQSAYTIVDRIGLSAELVPHLFGTANHRPTGTRGLYGYWRVGAVVTNSNAVRSLKIA
jgi:HK97 family phage major capsid protein